MLQAAKFAVTTDRTTCSNERQKPAGKFESKFESKSAMRGQHHPVLLAPGDTHVATALPMPLPLPIPFGKYPPRKAAEMTF